jgi:hypothetical protein
MRNGAIGVRLLVLAGLLASGQWACSSDDNRPAADSGGSTSFPAGGAGEAGSTVAGAGGSSGGGGQGGASGGSAGASQVAYCGSALPPTRTVTKTKVSDKAFDYKLTGAPGVDHHDVLLLLFNASSKNASTPENVGYHAFYTPEQLGDAFFDDPDGVAAFMNEASFGKVSLSGRVVGWFDQPTDPQPAAVDFQTNRDRYINQAAEFATFNDYDVIYIVGLTDGDDSLQLGWGLQNSAMTTQGKWEGGIDWMINSTFFTEAGQPYPYSTILPSRSWAHELHHTLGISGHDISLDCGTKTLDAACAFNPYGNVFSLMGESAVGNHASIGMKQVLGWLGPDQLQHVTTSRQVVLCPTETIDDKPKGLEIPLKTPLTITSTTTNMPAVFDRIFVEYRTPTGFDHYLDRLNDPNWQRRFLTAPREISKAGVVISLGYANEDTDSSMLLDMHPTPTDFTQDGIVVAGNAGKFLDAMLLVGETFELSEQGIKITPTAVEGGGIKVDVTY